MDPLPHDPTVEAEGRYFDGVSARPHPVRLHLAARFRVTGREIAKDWDPLDLRAGDSVPPLMRVGPAQAPDRVEFSDAALAAALTARCPDLHRREGAGGAVRLVLWSVAAGISVLLVAVFGVPYVARLLVPLVPDSVEARLGAVVEPQVVRVLGHPPACTGEAGRAALDRLVSRLVAARRPDGSLPADLAVSVRRHEMANALALPGARVMLLSGLIARATTPDEVAAVLAHELGHVHTRDPTRALIQASGTSFLLSLVLGDFTGSTVIVAVGEALLSAGYSRDAERAADAYAVETMARAGGNGAALADILERIAADDGPRGTLDLLRSHPLTTERAAAIRALAGPSASGRQILPEKELGRPEGHLRDHRAVAGQLEDTMTGLPDYGSPPPLVRGPGPVTIDAGALKADLLGFPDAVSPSRVGSGRRFGKPNTKNPAGATPSGVFRVVFGCGDRI